LKVNIKRD